MLRSMETIVGLTPNEATNISKFASWLEWRAYLDNFKILEKLTGSRTPSSLDMIWALRKVHNLHESNICPQCQGDELTIINGKLVVCLCALLNWTTELSKLKAKIAKPRYQTLEGMVTYGNSADQAKIKEFMTGVQDWIKNPQGNLLITGNTGIGKTRVMTSIYWLFESVSVYISATEFESGCFNALSDGKLTDYLDIFKQMPILLFDDWASGHGKGNIADEKFGEVIDYRYGRWEDHYTVASSNVRALVLYSMDEYKRPASRMMDTDKSQVIDLGNVPDYRVASKKKG